jgi:3'5'-cyclic nucleotide phosphodiesterase
MNNAYLITTRHPLATRYNDVSVLENSHVAGLYELIKQNPHLDIFQSLSNENWRLVRKLIINAVIHTDMTYHFPMVSKVWHSLQNPSNTSNTSPVTSGISSSNEAINPKAMLNLSCTPHATATVFIQTSPLKVTLSRNCSRSASALNVVTGETDMPEPPPQMSVPSGSMGLTFFGLCALCTLQDVQTKASNIRA